MQQQHITVERSLFRKQSKIVCMAVYKTSYSRVCREEGVVATVTIVYHTLFFLRKYIRIWHKLHEPVICEQSTSRSACAYSLSVQDLYCSHITNTYVLEASVNLWNLKSHNKILVANKRNFFYLYTCIVVKIKML